VLLLVVRFILLNSSRCNFTQSLSSFEWDLSSLFDFIAALAEILHASEETFVVAHHSAFVSLFCMTFSSQRD